MRCSILTMAVLVAFAGGVPLPGHAQEGIVVGDVADGQVDVQAQTGEGIEGRVELEAEAQAGVAQQAVDRDFDRRSAGQRAGERWRYRRHNNEWWYWHPDNTWMYWRDGNWNRYARDTYRLPRTYGGGQFRGDPYYYGDRGFDGRARFYPDYGTRYVDPYYGGRYVDPYGYGPGYQGRYGAGFRGYDTPGGRIGAGIGGAIGGREGAAIGGAIGRGIDR